MYIYISRDANSALLPIVRITMAKIDMRTKSFQSRYFGYATCTRVKWRGHVKSHSIHELPQRLSLFRNSFKCIHVNSYLCGKVVPYKLSDIGEGIVEVVIKEWLIKPGDQIAQFDPICEVQSDKASVTISSRYDGTVKKLYHEVDATAKVGEPLIDIELEEEDVAGEEGESAPSKESESKTTQKVASPGRKAEEKPAEHESVFLQDKALATPAVRRLAMENNIDLKNVKGHGKSGRILKEDVLLYMEKSNEPVQSDAVVTPSQTPPTMPSDGQDIVQTITGIRKYMVKSMNEAWKIPHFSYCDEVDVTRLVNMKEELKRLGQAKGMKITFMPFFIKAASLALTKYPILNSQADAECEKITIKASHNIGVAIDSPHGLVVPNIKNVQKLDLFDIARELNRLQAIAAKGQLGLDDMNGGTFTLSNIGIIGGTYTKPVIVAPQVIIGAIGKVQVLPRFDENKNVVPAQIFKISWSADHRVLDGATVARFSNLWKLYVEHPQILIHL